MSSAAAPSLSPDELPAVTEPLPSVRNAGLQLREHLERRVGADELVLSKRFGSPFFCGMSIGAISSAKRPVVARRRGLLLRPHRERVLIVAGHPVLLGHVLRRLSHRVGAVLLAHLRIDEAPAEARVEQLDVARERLARLRHHVRRARHALDAAGDVEVALAELHRARRVRDGAHARCAEAIDRLAGHAHRQAGEQHRHARDVAIVLARLVGAAEDDVGDVRRIERRMPRDERGDDVRGEIVGAHLAELPADVADGRANAVDDVCVSHVFDSDR